MKKKKKNRNRLSIDRCPIKYLTMLSFIPVIIYIYLSETLPAKKGIGAIIRIEPVSCRNMRPVWHDFSGHDSTSDVIGFHRF